MILGIFFSFLVCAKSIEVPIDKVKVPLGYSLHIPQGQSYDPNKPTIVYIGGGPLEVSQHQFRPHGLPENLQVLNLDYLGASRSHKDFPELPDAKSLMTSDNYAIAIAQVLKKEGLSHYVLYGESHGVQQALRTQDLLVKTGAVLPKSLVLDSGMGRTISEEDVEAKAHRGRPGFHGRCESASKDLAPRSGSQLGGRPTRPPLKEYLKRCGYPSMSRSASENLQNMIGRYVQAPPAQNLSAEMIFKQIGCPPVQKLDYSSWHYSMSCGSFEPGVVVRASCQDQCSDLPHPERRTCLRQCQEPGTCHDSALDVAKYSMGSTAVLGIQSMDDCNNYVESMDYLMDHLRQSPEGPVANRAYLKVPDAGGHVMARDFQGGFRNCLSAEHQNTIYQSLFTKNVKKASRTLQGCYQESVSSEGPFGFGER